MFKIIGTGNKYNFCLCWLQVKYTPGLIFYFLKEFDAKNQINSYIYLLELEQLDNLEK